MINTFNLINILSLMANFLIQNLTKTIWIFFKLQQVGRIIIVDQN